MEWILVYSPDRSPPSRLCPGPSLTVHRGMKCLPWSPTGTCGSYLTQRSETIDSKDYLTQLYVISTPLTLTWELAKLPHPGCQEITSFLVTPTWSSTKQSRRRVSMC